MTKIAWRFRPCLLVMAASLLAGCMSIDLETGFIRDESIHQQIIDQDRDLYAHIDPLALNDEIRQMIDGYIVVGDSEQLRVEKLQDILYGEEFLNIQYSDRRTHTAVEAFYAREGNCLSVMNLYVAMARYARLNANFQTVEVQPSWDRRGDLLVLSRHINATGRFNMQRRYVVDFTPEILLQQQTSAIVTDLQARALYFNNLGVEALIAEDVEQALVYFKNALFLEPALSITWNNIGATYRRSGNLEFAEYSYKMAFNADPGNSTSISNLAKFYQATGNVRLAREYRLAIERFNKENPYYHYAQGQVAYAAKDLPAARSAFQRALKLKEVEPDFYLALARVYIDMGAVEDAEKLNAAAQVLLTQNDEIYQPSDQKVRIIDSQSILRDTSPGLSIILSN